MKIDIDINDQYPETSVTIHAPRLSQDIEKLIAMMRVEEQLLERDFLRVSKQTIVNLRMIKSLKADINRKIRLTLQNGEQIMVSRMYSDELRQKLGVR